jgi:hypothetical protein
MYDVNPLGPMMHLKELDQQAVPKCRPLPPRRQDIPSLTALTAAMISLLRRVHTVGGRQVGKTATGHLTA